MAVYGATFWIGACRERLVSLQLVLRGQIGNHAELIGRELLPDRTQKVTSSLPKPSFARPYLKSSALRILRLGV